MFILADDATGRIYGPYSMDANEAVEIRNLNLRIQTNQTILVNGFVQGIGRTWGPFPLTNGARMNLNVARMTVHTGADMDAAIERQQLANEERKKQVREALQVGLLAYYPFNGNANDESGNGRNGTNYNGCYSVSRLGDPQGALSFNGRDAYVGIGSGLNPTQFSICAWVMPEPVGGCIISKLHNMPGQFYKNFEFRIEPDSTLQAHIPSGGGSWESVKSARTLGLQEWHHVAISYDGSVGKLFIDGREEPNKLLGSYAQSDVEVTIGARPESLENPGKKIMFFPGSLDDLRIYNRALSCAEVAQLYEIEYEGTESGPQLAVSNALPQKYFQVRVAKDSIGSITTLSERVLSSAVVTLVEPDGLTIQHAAGIAKYPFEDLPDQIRQQYEYDPARASAYRAEVYRRAVQKQKDAQERVRQMAIAREQERVRRQEEWERGKPERDRQESNRLLERQAIAAEKGAEANRAAAVAADKAAKASERAAQEAKKQAEAQKASAAQAKRLADELERQRRR